MNRSSTDPPAAAHPALRLALWLVTLAGWLVPAAERSAWREEWRAELITHASRAGRRDGVAARSPWILLSRALGCLPDAFYVAAQRLGPRSLACDLAHAARALARRPLFLATAVITLALGIGANAALFSVVRGVLLRPFPYHEPDRLVQLLGHRQGEAPSSSNISYPNLRDLGRDVGSLASVAGLSGWRPALTEGEPEVLAGATVSWEYFRVLGMEPAAGRFFLPENEGVDREPVVVISHALWTRRFGADPGVVGRVVSINGEPHLVLGVAPRQFEGPHLISFDGEQPDVWRTPWFEAADWYRSGRSWKGLARLAAGVQPEVAQAEVSAVMQGLEERFPEENTSRQVTLRPLRESVVGQSRSALYLLFGAVGLVLLVACVNVANLLIGRMLERHDELLVRRALGASRGRLVAHLFSESLAIAVLGGALGIGSAYMGVPAILAIAGPWLPRPEAIALDWTVLAFASLLALGTAILFGLLPAVRMVRDSAPSHLAGTRVGSSLGHRARGLRRALVTAQIATTVVLVIGAGLLLQTFANLHRVGLGLSLEGAVTMDLHGSAWLELDESAATVRYREILDRVAAVPGVKAVGGIDVVPLADNYSCDGFTPLDRPPPPPGQGRCAEVRAATPGALEALGIPLRSGRYLEWRDGPEAPGAMVVSRRTAEAFWPGEEPLGKQASIHGEVFRVVGVVDDLRHFGPLADVEPMVFLPAMQEPWNGIARGLSLVARGDPGDGRLGLAVRDAVHAAAPDVPVEKIRTMSDLRSAKVGGPRLRAFLLVSFAVLALVLALVGIVGVMAQSVARRRRELGIRLALGATPGQTSATVLAEGARITVLGLVAGLAGAALLTRLLRGFVFGVDPLDPAVLVVGSTLVCALSLLASWLPARRAGRIDPVEALRAE